MNEFLQSVKSDLLSRRLLPFVGLAAVLLIVAVGYAVAGGSEGATPAPSGNGGVAQATKGTVTVAVAPANPTEAVSETPAGARYQSQGPTRDPFTPLPSPPAAKTSGSSGSSSASSSTSKTGSSSSGSSSGGSGGGSPSSPAPTPAKPSKPAKPRSPYVVSVLFGLLPASSGQSVTLTPYENLTAEEPLPSKQSARIVYQRVTSDGKGAVFGFAVPPILHGSGVCLPSAAECQSLDLETGHSEELEYVEADGKAAIYELKIVSITKTSAAVARAKASAKAAVAKTRKP
ncbi:MAG TPA: hypothetical protein VGI26_08170 [Solirubrobacteraceae bacterium]|jgi:hypothetical protein